MLIGDYFDEIGRLIHEHETTGFLLSCDLLTDARSDARVWFAQAYEDIVREYSEFPRESIAEVLRFAAEVTDRHDVAA